MGKWLFNKMFPGEEISYKEKLIECVGKQMSGHQIAKEMHIDYTCVHRWLRKLGLHLPNYHNELKFDNTAFDIIDSEEKAYWLGFLYADGYVQSDGNVVELSLKGSDREHLEKFRSFLNNRNEIKMGTAKYGKKEFSRCRLCLTDKHFHDALISKGCIPNKSLILKFPNKDIFTSNNLIKHFIRGYFDGDGSVHKNSSNYSSFQILGTYDFLMGIKEYFPDLFSGAIYKNKKNTDSNTYFLSISGKKAAEFGDIMYSNAQIFMQRKYNKFIENKYDEREHLRRLYSFSEKRKLYYARGCNRNRKDCNLHTLNQ